MFFPSPQAPFASSITLGLTNKVPLLNISITELCVQTGQVNFRCLPPLSSFTSLPPSFFLEQVLSLDLDPSSAGWLGQWTSEICQSASPGEDYSPVRVRNLNYQLSHLSSTTLNVCLSFFLQFHFQRQGFISYMTSNLLFPAWGTWITGAWHLRFNILFGLLFGLGSNLETSSMTQGVQLVVLQPSRTEVACWDYSHPPLCPLHRLRMEPRCIPFIKPATHIPAQPFSSVCNLRTLYIL